MSELQKELDADRAFIEMVEERIYNESDNWEDSIAESEWIIDMTDIADKYLRRFKAAENGRRQVVQDKAKLIEMRGPELNENQKIVLDHFKKMCPKGLSMSLMVTIYRSVDEVINDNWQEYRDEKPEFVKALNRLDRKQEAQVLQAFATWALDQC